MKKTLWKRKRKIKESRNVQKDGLNKGEIALAVLGAVGAVGLVGAALVCPGLVHLVPRSYRGRYPYQAVWKAVVRLDKRGWIVARQMSDGWEIRLTPIGWTEWKAYEFGQKQIQTPDRWDKKWRVLMFDIPEKKKFLRDKIRRTLLSFGFYRLQDSVWVYPYECQEILELLRTRYRVRAEALYGRLEVIDNDRWLKQHYKLL